MQTGSSSSRFLQRSIQSQLKYGAMVQAGARGFAGGGPKKANIDPATTDFDIVFVGKFDSMADVLRQHFMCYTTKEIIV